MTDYATATLWLVVGLAGAGTHALRFSFVVAFAWIDDVPPRLTRALELVPAAVLSALVLPAILAPEGTVAFPAARIGAAAIAAVVAWRTENVAATIGVGMVALWAIRAV